MITFTPIGASGQTNRSIRIKETGRSEGIGVRCHLDGEVAVLIRLGVVHRRRVLSVLTLIPLGVHFHTSKRLTRVLDVTETNLGFDDLLHRARDRACLVRLARRVDSLILIATSCRSLRIRLVFLRIGNRCERGCRSNCVDEGAHHSNRERRGSNRSAATAYSSTLNFLLVHIKKPFP